MQNKIILSVLAIGIVLTGIIFTYAGLVLTNIIFAHTIEHDAEELATLINYDSTTETVDSRICPVETLEKHIARANYCYNCLFNEYCSFMQLLIDAILNGTDVHRIAPTPVN